MGYTCWGEFVVYKMKYMGTTTKTPQKESKQPKSEKSVMQLNGHSVTKFLLPDTPTEITRTAYVQPLLRNGSMQHSHEATLVVLSNCYPGIDYVDASHEVYQATCGKDRDRNG